MAAYLSSMPIARFLKVHAGRRGGGAVSWSMENYFQAEAFNLDKVLDEFEQNEGEHSQLIDRVLKKELRAFG